MHYIGVYRLPTDGGIKHAATNSGGVAATGKSIVSGFRVKMATTADEIHTTAIVT